MSRNASGTYTLPSGNPVSSGTDITVTWGNNTMNDIATELTDSLSRSGKGGMLAPMLFNDGTESVPGIAWVSDANSGFYRIGADNLAMSLGGTKVIDYADGSFSFIDNADTASVGPIFSIFRDSASPADADLIGDLRFDGKDSAGNKTTYASISSQIDDVTNGTEDGTLLVKSMTAGTLTTQLDVSSALVNITPPTTIAGLTTIASLKGTGAVTITDILDEDNMSSNSATKLATQQSIKAYVDAQVDTVDTLAEVLAIGNTTGGTDVSVTTTDKVQFRDTAIYINSSVDGQLDIVADTEIQIAATTIDINGAVNASGEIIAASLDISGDIDVDGTANLDIVDIDGAVDMASTLTVAGLTTIASLKGTGAVTVTDILDEDNMASNSATKLSTQQSIKAYVDAQVDTADTLAEVLAIGNTTGGTDVSVSTTDKVQFRDAAIYINSSADGQLDIVADTEIQIAATTVDLNGNLDVSGTALVTGVLTTTATQVATGGITSGGDIISDTDSTDSIGSTGVRWLKGWYDTLQAGTLVLGAGSITDTSGAIDFGNENLVTTGTLGSGAATIAGDVHLDIASGAAKLTVDSGSAGAETSVYYTQNGADRWRSYVDSNQDYGIYNYGTSTESLNIDGATDAAVFAGNLSSGGYISGTGGTSYLGVSSGATKQYEYDNGQFYPSNDNARTLGHPSFRWSTIYATNATINTSDERQKTPLKTIDDLVLDAFEEVSVGCYQWLDAIEKKGESGARIHFGYIAQQIIAVFEAKGLDPFKYAPICADKSPIDPPEDMPPLDTDMGIENGDIPFEYIYGLRYGQLAVLSDACRRRDKKNFEARLEALEA